MLARCPPLRPVDVALGDAARAGAGRRRRRRRGRAAVRQHRRRRLRRAGRRRRGGAGRARRSSARWPPARRRSSASAPGEAIRIMTGAPMPAGADAVVMVEDTERLGDDRVRIATRRCRRRRGPRAPATTSQPGDVLFTAGTVVTPAVVGVLASVNARTVSASSGGPGRRAVDRRRAGRPTARRCARARSARATPMLAGLLARGRVRGRRPRRRRRRRGRAGGGAARGGRATCDAIVTSGGVSAWATTTSSRRCSAGSPR